MERILVVDDHPVYAAGLKTLLELEPDLAVVGVAANGREALDLCERLWPDVVVLDVILPDGTGPAVVQGLRRVQPNVAIVVLTAYDEKGLVAAMIHAGANAYLLKVATAAEIVDAIRAVAAGGSRLSPSIARQVMEQFSMLTHRRGTEPANRLTAREQQVLNAIAHGLNNREIARELVTTERTIQNHLHSIYRKLEVRDRAQAILYALQHAIVVAPAPFPTGGQRSDLDIGA